MIECVLCHNLDVLVELLSIACLVGIRVPVVAARADADDAAFAILGGILPSHDGTVATNTEHLASCARLPCSMAVIAAPVGADVVLCCGVGDMIAGIRAINLIGIVACDKILIEWMVVLSIEDAEAPWTATKFGSILVLAPTVVRGCPFVVAGDTDERRQVGGVTGKEHRTTILIWLSDVPGIDAAAVKMVFDFGGNPDDTEVTISNIVLKDHAIDDGTVLPNPETKKK